MFSQFEGIALRARPLVGNRDKNRHAVTDIAAESAKHLDHK
jgi:hypothetical protein